MNTTRITALFLGLFAGLALSAQAAEVELQEVKIPQDVATLERGAEVVSTVCMGCHSLKYVKYRDMVAAGVGKDKVDGWRAGQPLESPMQSQMSEDAARASFGGVLPPDLSLIANARDGREHYIYSYLVGYHKNDKGELTNTVFPVTRMPDILGSADANDAQSRAAVEAKAKDVTAFLLWAADPHAVEREHMGYYVLGYVAIMTLLLFMWKKQIWREIDKRPKIS